MTHHLNFTPVERSDVLPHGGSKWVVRTTPSPLGKLIFVGVITGEKGEFSYPEKMRIPSNNKISWEGKKNESIKIEKYRESLEGALSWKSGDGMATSV